MRCLVTGATGFIGSHLVRELLRRGHSVVMLLRTTSRAERLVDCREQVDIVRGSMSDLSALRLMLSELPVDAAFHLAWSDSTAGHRNGREQVMDNVTQSLALWEVLRATGCKTFIGVGSQAEYGLFAGTLKEDSPTDPVTAYGSSKLALGILLRRLCAMAGMRFVWLRLFSAYGPGDDERRMVPQLISTLLRHEKPSLTACEQIWDYLYIADAIDALCASVESKADGVFNLASGSPCELRQFVVQVRDYIDPSLPIGFGEIPYCTDQVMHLEADISRLATATGWQPKVSWRDGIRVTVESYRACQRDRQEVPPSYCPGPCFYQEGNQ